MNFSDLEAYELDPSKILIVKVPSLKYDYEELTSMRSNLEDFIGADRVLICESDLNIENMELDDLIMLRDTIQAVIDNFNKENS